MQNIINPHRFLKALEYTDAHFFAIPFSITPMVGRWFNQLAMIELADGQILHLSNKLALDYVDIILDGEPVNKQDLRLVFKFHDLSSEHEKKRIALESEIHEANQELLEASNDELKLKVQKLQERLHTFDANKIKAKSLYDAIVARGTSVLNEERLESKFNSKIKNIVYRPNHGLTHSSRAAYLIPAIYEFDKNYNVITCNLSTLTLEKLQLMMLFSVVGRKDETGFNDDDKGRATYQKFRASSGQEYITYCNKHASFYYHNNLEQLYQDAIVIEVMGYSTIEDCIGRRQKPPELFIEYVMAKELKQGHTLTREDALTLITKKKYSLSDLYSPKEIRAIFNTKLKLMNQAHGIDLSRCYPLFASKDGGPDCVKTFNNIFSIAGIYTNSELDTNLTSVFKLLRNSFDALEVTGQKTTVGLISEATFNNKKKDLLNTIAEINQNFNQSQNSEHRSKLLDKAKHAQKKIEPYWNFNNPTDDMLLDYYRKYLILKKIAKQLTDTEKLNPNKKMFDFQHSAEANPHKVNHHQNAVSLLNALQSIKPAPGISLFQLPVISSVIHERDKQLVTVFFDTQKDATHFKNVCTDLFEIALASTQNKEGLYCLNMDRTQYQQLVNEKLVEFKQAKVPTHVNRESSLIDEQGNVDAISLIAHSQGLVRLISTSALNGEDFPDYDYLLKALEHPTTERYSRAVLEIKNFPEDHAKYYDPRNGTALPRHRSSTSLPELRFQEPVTKPVSLTDKLADGWTKSPSRLPRNTIFIKKLAHSLLPPHGKVQAFSGYPGKKTHFFPIGILSDLQKVDLKDERYVWAQNMDTFTKFWVRDTSFFDKKLYQILHAQLDSDLNLIRYQTGVAALDKNKLRTASSPEVLIKYLEKRKNNIIEKLNLKHYRPDDKVLADFRMLLKQECKEYLDHAKSDKSLRNQIKKLYASIEQRLDLEVARKHPKYAITIRELIEQQKKTQQADKHNEIMAANTKEATRAFYSPKDELFDRLNLAFHALNIKKTYHYDVPLLIISEHKPPYHYTESMIKADLQEAYKLLRAGLFPYDQTQIKAYELDKHGNALLEKGKPIRKKDNQGNPLMKTKDLVYQKNLLINLFQLGLPDLKQIQQLETGAISPAKKLDDQCIDEAINSIISQMNVIGGSSRETELMHPIMEQPDNKKKEEFFLRQAALGHQSLIKELLSNDQCSLSMSALEKAMQFAQNNNHPSLYKLLEEQHTKLVTFKAEFDFLSNALKTSSDSDIFINNLNLINTFKNQNKALIAKFGDCEQHVTQKLEDRLLNPSSTSIKNKAKLAEFNALLATHPKLAQQYWKIIKSNQMVQLDELIAASKRLGVEAITHALSIIATRGWEQGNNYLLLLEFKDDAVAAQYIDSETALTGKNLDHIYKLCMNILKKIEEQAIGQFDSKTHDYCEAMRTAIQSGKDNYPLLAMNLQKLTAQHKIINSPELSAIKEQIARLEQNAQSFFSIGNNKKIERIKHAIAQVPLNLRDKAFSGDHPACAQVRAALASHRISFTNPMQADNTLQENKAAKSYTEVKRQLEESDQPSDHEVKPSGRMN